LAGYVRQSAADIVPTAVVRAAPINNELNALRDAFVLASGHKHDGTAAEGAYIPLISDTNAYTKVAIDSSNNRIGFFVNVSSAAVEQVRIQDGAIVPVTDNDIDLGTSSLEFKDLYIDGTANIDSLVADTADINGGTIDNATIGASTPAAGTFTNLTVNSSATIASADINAGAIDGTVIGASSAQAITGTTITASTGFVGGVTGNVTGNLTGNVTGNVAGNVTGDLTGNVTASSGTSTFNNVTINGGLDMNAGTTATITNLTSPTSAGDAATKGYVDTQISNLVDSAPGALDTLNELAAALGDDASFSTTVTNSLAGKLSLTGGTMSGAIAMGTSKITGLGDPTANQDAATKVYVDTQRDTRLALAGGTMSGAIAMSTNKITGMGDPTNAQDAATKNYIDVLFGSTTSAAASAAAAAISESNAANSASDASGYATDAQGYASDASGYATTASNAASSAATSYDNFDDRYLGAKSSAPTLDNDGDALIIGALYFDTTTDTMKVYGSGGWTSAGSSVNGTADRFKYTATSSQTTFTGSDDNANTLGYDAGFLDVYLNGVKLVNGVDFTATNGTSIVLSTGAVINDILEVIAYGTFSLASFSIGDANDVSIGGVTNNQALLYNSGGSNFVPGTVLLPANIGSTVQAYDSNLTTFVTNFTLPSSDGGSGQALVTNGSGTLSFSDAGISTGKAIAMAIVFG